MYFAILGKHTQISWEELRYLQPIQFRTYSPEIVFFDTPYPTRISQLAGIVKRWEIYNYNQLKEQLIDCPIIGVHDSKSGKQLKSHFGIKRFKLIESLLRTDREIQQKWKEILLFQTKEWQSYGVVTGYQNIKLYEVIDFDKPARSMQVGMMPAKLTHMMINIWLTYTAMDTMSNIYDPFCGLGTTILMANALGYHAIGSDINPEHAHKNINRRKTTRNQKPVASSQQPAANMYIFQHDVTHPFTEPKIHNAPLIVTEWWLWPIVTTKTTTEQIADYSKQVEEVYSKFFKNIADYFVTSNTVRSIGDKNQNTKKPAASSQQIVANNNLPTIVITIPYYIDKENHIADHLTTLTTSLGREHKIIKEIYTRPKQQVGRQIAIFTPQK